MKNIKLKTYKEFTPKIYAYTTPGIIDNDGWIKIGYTKREVEKRIKEQTHTAGVTSNIRWVKPAQYTEEPDKGKLFDDHPFHQFLKYHNIDRRPSTEWFYFNGNPEDSEKLFEKFAKHDTSDFQPGQGMDYILRQEQEDAVEKTLEYAKKNPNGEFLWNAKPRFGKTLSTYDFAERLGAKQVLIVTNRPAIANSWFDDFDKFIAGKTDYKFVSETEALKNRPALSRKDYVNYLGENADVADELGQIAFISLQDLKGSAYFGGTFDKLKWVSELHWDLLVIDEAHEGIDTLKTDVAFDKIKRNFTLHLSGTPFKALAKGKFGEEQIYNWSYADEQSAKENWDVNQDEENPYEDLPKLNMFTYQMSKMIDNHLDGGTQLNGETIDFAFDLNEFFATNESGKFIHEKDVKSWLETLTRNEKYPFSTKELRNELKHTFWLLDRVASAKAMKKLLEDNPVFENYEIILAAGKENAEDSDDSKLKAIDKVKKAIAEHEKTITLSVGQLTTGVTIPQWTGVLMLSNLKSPAQYMQAAFRAQNPYYWTDKSGKYFKKENAYVFDFAPERTLILFDEFANNLSLATASGHGTSETRQDNIKKLLNFFPVISEDSEGKMVEIDAKSVMVIPRKIKAQEVLKRGFMSNLLFDNIGGIFRATQTVLDILNELPSEKEGKSKRDNEWMEFPDVNVDDEGNVVVDDQLIINQQTHLFGEKVYELENDVNDAMDLNDDLTYSKYVNEVNKQVSKVVKDTLISELDSEYELTRNETKSIKKNIEEQISDRINRSQIERKISEANIKNEYKQRMEEETSQDAKRELKEELSGKLKENDKQHREILKKEIQQEVSKMPENVIRQVEVKRAEKNKEAAQQEIRGHLRGFARTIPSFIMAYGDKNLTLDNFDHYVPDNIFYEVTGITTDQFRYLRDGGTDFEGHLFDRATFDEAIQEFLRKKEELSDYFDEQKEDIFDYIPPQETNQVFTPKRIVKKMVDDLEKETPGIFDDSSKTFIDLYMKSGLYITEIVKKLYNSEVIKAEISNDRDRLKHILENQVYGFAATEILYRIATNFIFGNFGDEISKKNFVQADTIPYAQDGKIQELVDKYFG